MEVDVERDLAAPIMSGRWTRPRHGSVHVGVRAVGSRSASADAVMAAVPIAYWDLFFVALAVPGTGVDDPPPPAARPLSMPITC